MNHQSPCAVKRLLALGTLLAGVAACGSGAGNSSNAPPVAKPGVLSISAMPQLVPYPSTVQDYVAVATQAFNLAYNAGARGQMNTWTWSALEPSAGNYDAQKFADLDAAVVSATSHGLVLYVGIQVINTTVLEVPSDLAGAPLDSVAMQNRFKALLDRVVTPYRGKIRYLSMGNEVDGYLRNHPADWATYKTFFTAMAAYARSLDPGLQVGVTGTAEGARSLSTSELANLNAASDVVILTYYPVQFPAGVPNVRGPEVVAADFAAMRSFAGSKPLVLQEVGYPAAASIGSSDAQQATFVANVFASWKAAPAGSIPFVNYFLLHDFTPQMCTSLSTYYGATGSTAFADFLCSLGLRQADGTPRPAWSVFVDQARATGLP